MAAVVENVSAAGGCHKEMELDRKERLRGTVGKNQEDSGSAVFIF